MEKSRFISLMLIFAVFFSMFSLSSTEAEEDYLYIEITSPEENTILTGSSTCNMSWELITSYNESEVNIYIEYVYEGKGPYPIAGPLPGDLRNYSWEVPSIDSEEVNLILRGEKGDSLAWSMLEIAINSTTPDLISLTPSEGDTILTTDEIKMLFTEPILQKDLQNNFSLSADGEMFDGVFSFEDVENGTLISFVPFEHFDREKVYSILLNGTFRDKSLPGNEVVVNKEISFYVEEGPPSVSVLEPTRNSVHLVETYLNITWDSDETISADSPVNISFSPDGGESWMKIREEIEDAGEFKWKIPERGMLDYPIEDALINVSITGIDGHIGYGHSSTFQIFDNFPPSVIIKSPYEGDYAIRGYHYRIKWEAEDVRELPHEPITISVSSDGGDSWRVVGQSLENKGYFDWKVDVPSGEAMINVTCEDSRGTVSWNHSGVFTVLEEDPLSVSITYLNETHHSREYLNVTWDSPPLLEEVHLIRINFTADGESWRILAETEPDNNYQKVQLPFEMSSNCKIRVKILAEERLLFYSETEKFEVFPLLEDFSVIEREEYVRIQMNFDGWVSLSWVRRALNIYRNNEKIEIDPENTYQRSSLITYFIYEPEGGEYRVEFDSEGLSDREFTTREVTSFSVGEEEKLVRYHLLLIPIPAVLVISYIVLGKDIKKSKVSKEKIKIE